MRKERAEKGKYRWKGKDYGNVPSKLKWKCEGGGEIRGKERKGQR
jgi:hypothetical protein